MATVIPNNEVIDTRATSQASQTHEKAKSNNYDPYPGHVDAAHQQQDPQRSAYRMVLWCAQAVFATMLMVFD